jgi:glycosyltransferase involved in cell wall biosynthesis
MVPLAADDEIVCFVDGLSAVAFDLEGSNVRQVRVDQGVAPTQAASSESYRSPVDMLRFTRAVSRERLDVFFSPSVYTYFPLPPGLPALVTVHDAIAERFPELTLPSRRARLFWRAKVKLAIWQSRLVLTVSNYSARELVDVLAIPSERLRVALEAPAEAYRPSTAASDLDSARKRLQVPEDARWFVYVGGFNPHKRLDRIVRAHAKAAAQVKNPPYLVLVGSADRDDFHKDVGAIKREIEGAGTGDLVRWTGFVADDDLRHIHSGATAAVLVSESEGFGLPAIEAAACGAPVIATTESPLPELLEGGGIFVNPSDEAGLTAAMIRMLTDEPARRAMGERARQRAAELSWDRTAAAVLSAIHEAGGVRTATRSFEHSSFASAGLAR